MNSSFTARMDFVTSLCSLASFFGIDVGVKQGEESESYFWTNIAPQDKRLRDSAWGPIEDWMLERAKSDHHRATVFTGPVLTLDDPVH